MTDDLTREHWIVPIRGVTSADSDGVVQVAARGDGTVRLNLTCGDSRITVQLDVCRAAQLCTGIWEAAGAAQHLTDDQPPPSPPPPESEDLPEAWRAHLSRNASLRGNSSRSRRKKQTPKNTSAAMDATRLLGLRLRRIRHAREKSLQVISGLAGMSTSTLHHIEYGRRELTLSEIVALANALQIDPWKLIKLPTLTPPDSRR